MSKLSKEVLELLQGLEMGRGYMASSPLSTV